MGKRGNRGESVVRIKLYVEGGGSSKELKGKCRKAFRAFIEKVGLQGRMPRIVVSGSRRNAYEDFETRHRYAAKKDETALLLVDAEAPVKKAQPWEHLKDRDGWDRPEGASDDQCHLMVQAMESWFLADRAALGEFYGQGFHANSLPSNPEIEQIAKKDVDDGLNRASRNTTKRRYDKGRHSFEILARIDPAKVANASPQARRFINVLVGLAEGKKVF